ncbi:NADP-dependent oxidoreductase [Ktedonosporobacter rubrisoli]|uniref:NADP-dependent oxidoreductase n=2 Tax=Ktedonosporobacter rubrisoli TaxID=2509675 RepID=A0A4P6K773_KTERU|nr:NADP-dependent oxidoreductase [Ktedonosporobacter rubrisoli]
MQAIVINAFGGPEQLVLQEVPRPEPGPDEVLIRVEAAGIGPWDIKVRESLVGERQFPFILGWESAGIIEQVGADVRDFAVGDAVYCYVREVGHYAEYIAVPAKLVARRPRTLDAAHAAAIPVSGITAHQAITEDLKLQAGETVLITAAAGGTGTFAVQIAASLGAHVIASASARNHAYLRELGAHEVIDYALSDVVEAVHTAHPLGVDAVLDCRGGEGVISNLSALRAGGRMAFITEAPEFLPSRGISAHMVIGRPDAQRLAVLAHMVDEKQLAVHLERAFPLAQAREAHELVETGHVRGKVVLTLA